MLKAFFPLVLLALVFAVSGCGGGSSTTTSTASASPAAQWADGLCSALLTYKDAIQTAGATLKSGAVSGSAIDEATSSVTGATEDFRDDVKALPDPQLASAQTIQDTLTGLSTALSKDADTIRAASGEQPLALVSVVSSTLLVAQDQVASAVETLKGVEVEGELQDAFDQAPVCDAFSNL
jgi:hypothetical protein